MKKLLIVPIALLLLASCGSTAWYSWEWTKIPADGHRTGVTAPNAENSVEALGISNGKFYSSPGGKIYVGGVTPQVAALLIDAQPEMADLKSVIGHSNEGMAAKRPESALSDWAVDVLMEKAAAVTGRKIDVGILNFGGIRTYIPQGEVLKDDLVSMFPFKNYLAIVTLKGSRLREIYTQMAQSKPEVVGGAQLVIRDHALESVTIGGEPLDDDAIYTLATIDFLLKGGDKYFLGEGVENVEITDVQLINIMLPKILEMTAAGQTIDYHTDGRVKIITEE